MPRKVIIPETNIRKQEQTQWCYASVIQMILEHYNQNRIPQSEIVRRVTGTNTDNSPQDATDYLMNTLNYIDKKGCSRSVLQFKKIKAQIDLNRPIVVLLGGGSGHYILIVGYNDSPNDQIYIDHNKSNYNIESVNVIDGITTVNTVYIDADTKKEVNGPSSIVGYCLTQPGTFMGGLKSRKSRSTRKKRGGKWSLKYKRSINCKRPKGFSQKQHCKYGRK
jgi:ABC-type bacteriocin/lantibiotic exporter with double-glycine peptidase domain